MPSTAISLILNGLYEHHSLASDDYRRAGFRWWARPGPARRVCTWASELSFAASIDDKFYGQLTLTMDSAGGETHTGIEEAYIDTTALPDGFTLRAGRFYPMSATSTATTHTDFFGDRPLAYQAFLGNQYGDDGVQARWVAPTDTYLEIGGEVFRGDNFPAGGAANAGSGVKTLFLHAGATSAWSRPG